MRRLTRSVLAVALSAAVVTGTATTSLAGEPAAMAEGVSTTVTVVDAKRDVLGTGTAAQKRAVDVSKVVYKSQMSQTRINGKRYRSVVFDYYFPSPDMFNKKVRYKAITWFSQGETDYKLVSTTTPRPGTLPQVRLLVADGQGGWEDAPKARFDAIGWGEGSIDVELPISQFGDAPLTRLRSVIHRSAGDLADRVPTAEVALSLTPLS